MSDAPAYPADAYNLEYRPDQHLLIGRWLHPVALAEAQAIYEATLQAALLHECRHWLLDIRRRPVSNEALMAWFGADFTPRLAAAFNQPLYLAYFAMITHDEAISHPVLAQNVLQGSHQDIHYHYGNDEGDCLAWLTRQP